MPGLQLSIYFGCPCSLTGCWQLKATSDGSLCHLSAFLGPLAPPALSQKCRVSLVWYLPWRRRGEDGWLWGMALPPPQGAEFPVMTLIRDRKVGMVTLWPAALLSVLPVDNPRGESGDLWRGSKVRPPFVPYPKSSLGAMKILELSCLFYPALSWKRSEQRWLR